MDKQAAQDMINTLEGVAGRVESLVKDGKLSPELAKLATKAIHDIDSISDRIEITAFGQDAFLKRRAEVIHQDADEPYMKTFENVQKPLQTDADEPYMHKTEKSFNSKGIPTYDDDKSSSVRHRDEYDVRDLSEHTDKTQKQPSWDGASSGKSTHQGSEKTWAS
ncbi:MAG TPA: hypothetical protein VIE65_17315 [Methylobacter sp.]|jgi:hypothetical protein